MDLKDANNKTTVLQSKLYQAARQNAGRRFHQLYDKLFREDVLTSAWGRVAENNGSPGIDGVTIQSIRDSGVEEYLKELGDELRRQEYKPLPLRRVDIPKANGKVRSLGIPTVRDRIVQACMKLLLEPIFEADFLPLSYGFRPGLGQLDALAAVKKSANKGFQFVVDADIEGCFDNFDHEVVMESLRRRICDGAVLRLIYRWLKAGVYVGFVRDEGEDTPSGDVSPTDQGTPQGGVISPLLANICLHRFDTAFAKRGKPFLGRLVRFADDMVIQCGTMRHAQTALNWMREQLSALGLRLSDAKTSIVKDSEAGFDFMGFHHRRVPARIPGHGNQKVPVPSEWTIFLSEEPDLPWEVEWNLRWPSKRACQKFRDKIKEHLARAGWVRTPEAWDELTKKLNRFIRGWGGYFRHSNCTRQFAQLDRYTLMRVARFLARCQPQTKKRRKRPWVMIVSELTESKSLIRLADHRKWPSNDYLGKANIRWKAV